MDIDRNGTIDFPEFVKMLIKSYNERENNEEDLKAVKNNPSTFIQGVCQKMEL